MRFVFFHPELENSDETTDNPALVPTLVHVRRRVRRHREKTEHGGKPAEQKEHGGKPAEQKEHGGKPAEQKEDGGQPAKQSQ